MKMGHFPNLEKSGEKVPSGGCNKAVALIIWAEWFPTFYKSGKRRANKLKATASLHPPPEGLARADKGYFYTDRLMIMGYWGSRGKGI